MLRNHVEKSCWAWKGFSSSSTSDERRGGDGCSVSNGHFFGRRAEKFLWGTRDTKVSIWWRRGGSSDNQGGENSSSKKATTSKGTLYLLGNHHLANNPYHLHHFNSRIIPREAFLRLQAEYGNMYCISERNNSEKSRWEILLSSEWLQ